MYDVSPQLIITLCVCVCEYISDYDVCEGAIWMKDESRYKYE